MILIYPESWTEGELYLYEGTGRTNLTLLYPDIKVGAPVAISVSQGAVIIYQRSVSDKAASLQFSVQVVGQTYPWYEYIFLGQSSEIYYFGLVSLTVLTFLLPLPVILLIILFIFSQVAFTITSVFVCCLCCRYLEKKPREIKKPKQVESKSELASVVKRRDKQQMRAVEEVITEVQKQKRQLKSNEADLVAIKEKKERITNLLSRTNKTIPANLYVDE